MTLELVRLSRNDSPIRLVCFPPAGGAASGFHAVARALAPEAAVYAAQPPGRERRIREAAPESILDFAADVLSALRGVANSQTALFGHSMGAVVAYEAARALEREGYDLPLLIVSACPAPLGPWPFRVRYASDDHLVALLDELGGTPAEVMADEAMRNLLLRTYRSDLIALESYVPAQLPKLRCPVVGLAGAQDDSVPRESVRDWRKVTTASFRLEVMRGGHMFLQEPAFTVRLRELVLTVTDSALPRSAPSTFAK